MSAVKGNQENTISGKQKDSVQKEMLAASVSTTVSVERKHNRPLLLQDCRHKMLEKALPKVNLPEAAVLLERDTKKRADITS